MILLSMEIWDIMENSLNYYPQSPLLNILKICATQNIGSIEERNRDLTWVDKLVSKTTESAVNSHIAYLIRTLLW